MDRITVTRWRAGTILGGGHLDTVDTETKENIPHSRTLGSSAETRDKTTSEGKMLAILSPGIRKQF